MDSQIDYEFLEPSHERQFSTSLGENLDAVIESLQVVQSECDVVGDIPGAHFLEGIATAVRAFTLTHVPFGRPGEGRSHLQLSLGRFTGSRR